MKVLAAMLLLSVSLAHATAPAPVSPERWIGAKPGIIVSVAPGSKPGLYKATALLIDSRAGQVIDSLSEEAAAGQETYLEGKSEGMGHTTAAGASITISADGKSATYTIKVEQDGAVTRTESGTVSILAPGV
ncbi:hypothetical protein [Lysobacter xanthus]